MANKNSRQHIQTFMNTSSAIRQEIQRFESVHPSIYAIYDLIELVPDTLIAQQIRDHVVCIEDSFVNSQEWTVSRSVPDLRLGILGSLCSGKSALVHRYLTGSYMQEESPEGGRFKKEILLDGQSHLLLIRDEGGPPELQFTLWVDAVIFVFSLENETSFNTIYGYYTKMAHYRNSTDIPLILVGTQDAISENNPRVIDDSRARKLAAEFKRCTYYETCATYGLNVERVFQDACHKIVQHRSSVTVVTPSSSRPTTPNPPPQSPPLLHLPGQIHVLPDKEVGLGRQLTHTLSASSHQLYFQDNNINVDNLTVSKGDLPTPSSTPNTVRKTRRRSNLFNPSKKGEEKLRNGGELGSGRAIPLKQGYLYKRSSKALNKEWKKKYVTLCDDGRLTYHPSLHDYMEDAHGKEISLQYVTVKVPGQKPRGSKTVPQMSVNSSHDSITSSCYQSKEKRGGEKVMLTAFELLKEPRSSQQTNIDDPTTTCNGSGDCKAETPSVKKRHRRLKSSGVKQQECDDCDGFEFLIVSLDNKQWHFEASKSDDRDDWVSAIEQQILSSLQGSESSKLKSRLQSSVELASIQTIRTKVRGNAHCADCDAPNPEWASLNLGLLMCIECCGVHRNLGSHVSRVRSLHLDEWPPGHLAVMLSIGNSLGNSVWEAVVGDRAKPTPGSSREEKERWIHSKYESKEFLPPLSTPTPSMASMTYQFFEAVSRSDIKSIILMLAHGGSNLVNSMQDSRSPLHVACSMGNLPIAQLLIWYNADLKCVDQDGRTCLGLARASQRITGGAQTRALVELLAAHGCPEFATTTTFRDINILPASVI